MDHSIKNGKLNSYKIWSRNKKKTIIIFNEDALLIVPYKVKLGRLMAILQVWGKIQLIIHVYWRYNPICIVDKWYK